MQKQIVYQLDSKGNVKQWSVQVSKNADGTATILVEHGLENGAITPESTIIKEGKNPGKANETTPFTQAVKEAESKLAGKIRKGYVADKTQLKASHILGSGVTEPMLAHKYHAAMKQSSSKNFDKLGIKGNKIYVQRKKDGNRCKIIVTREANGTTSVKLYTRKGDAFPTNGLEHIVDSIRKSFDKSFDFWSKKYGITSYSLDGELFTKEFSFNKLNGLATKEDKDDQDLIDAKHIVYHLYDIELAVGYETRYKIYQSFNSPSVHAEEAIETIADDKEINKYLEQFLEEGEEGLMIRQLGLPYENKRSWQLMKVKVFEDDEFECVGFEESVKGGMVGAIWVKAPAGCFDRNGVAITKFKAGAKFSHEECREMWNNQKAYIGKKATVEFFGKSEYGIPRFGKCRKILL